MPSKCRFIDVDGTIFKSATEEWLPGVEAQLEEWVAAGDTLILFTMRPIGPWLEKVKHLFQGYIHKPCADEYYLYEDRLVEGRQSICCSHQNQETIEGRQYCQDCNIWLYPDELLRTQAPPRDS